MILDSLLNLDRYAGAHPRFQDAFAWLKKQDLASLENGRYEIDGDALYAMVMTVENVGHDAARLEGHRRYIDIQAAVQGKDEIGWSLLGALERASDGYDEGKDVQFFAGAPDVWLPVETGSFCLLFPHDLHAPCAGVGPLKKVVVKVAV